MATSVGNNNPTAQNYAGIGIYCNVIDPSKLPPDSPLLKNPMPNCTIVGAGGNNSSDGGCCCYPSGYYMNNYANNTVKKRVVVLTDEYIKQLENYLNSEDTEIREYAASEVIKRLDEDKTRYNDKAMNALVNKMILDPYDRKVRERGLIALDSQLASGDENTKTVLEFIKQDPNLLDRDRGLIETCLLQMSADTTIVNQPITTTTGSTTV
ncbi:MAG: hypothetical protein LUB59_04520 [Candidatus Gastranaerophilales bacterium]|nr:hypothetical protein [Candidatus Gastranaerophilales bacterium]